MATLGTLTEVTFTNLDGAADADRDQSAAVDLSSAVPDHLIFTVQVTPTAGAGSATGYVDFFMAESAEGTSTNLSGGASGSDATYAPTGEAAQAGNLRAIGRLSVDGTTTTAHNGTFVVPGPIPAYFSVVSENQIGEALSSTGANNFVKYQTVT